MKWMVPINSLDAVQQSIIDEILEDPRSSHLVRGFAGSGKTIVLTHVLERLASLRQRPKVCFATYTHALKDMVESGLSAAARARVDIETFDALRFVSKTYDIVVADELQDVPSRRLESFERSYSTLIAAADFDQRIYRQAASIDDIEGLLDGCYEHQLQEIHRLNEYVFLVATSVYDADVPGDATVRDDDELTQLYVARNRRDEFTTVYDEASRQAAPEHPSAVLLPTKKLMKAFIDELADAHSWGSPPELENSVELGDKYQVMNRFLSRAGTTLQIFGSGSGEMALSDRRPVVYLMTYHSAKGLDFPFVFLPHLTAETSLDPMKNASDEDERRLFFVAATRAKRRLFLSYHGEAHRFFEDIDPRSLVTFKKPRRVY